MKKLLKDIARGYFKSEDGKKQLLMYSNLTKFPEWSVHKEFLLIMKGTIAEQMFSDEFTKMGKEEKDVKQRTYANMNEVINFLLNPLKGIESEVRYKQHNNLMEATHGKQPKASKK